MKYLKKSLCFFPVLILFFITVENSEAQKVGFISSEVIREHFPEAKLADQRIQSFVEEWKRELNVMQQQIEALEFEIEKNRLVWSDVEKAEKEKELEDKKKVRLTYAKTKFDVGGEYDTTVKEIMKPIEEKIYASVQEVAADEGYDVIIDQSIQPMAYANYKYDLTVKVLRKLGVDVEELEKELQEKIKKDPRNKKAESYKPRRRSRSRDPNKRRAIERTTTPENPTEQPPDEDKKKESEKEKGSPSMPFKR